MNRMNRKFRAISHTLAFAAMLVLALSISTIAAAETITVNNNMGSTADYTSIQAAVNGAHKGDTILVYPGTYKENVNVNVENLSIRSFSGNPEDTVIEGVDSYGSVFKVTSNYGTISGFTFMGAAGGHNVGVNLRRVSGSNISNNIISNNNYGIYLCSSDHNKLTGNLISNNNYGIYSLYSSDYNKLTGNLMWNNTYNFYEYGIFSGTNHVDTSNLVNGKPIYYLVNVSDIKLDASSNAGTVYLINCKNASVRDLLIEESGYGIYLYNTTNSILENNSVLNNEYGIHLESSSCNELIGNTASSNKFGIYLEDSGYNTVNENNASENEGGGIYLEDSGYNTVNENNASENEGGGIYLRRSGNNSLTGNNANLNNLTGIKLDFSSKDNYLKENNAEANRNGICLDSSCNELSGNTVNSNIEYGILVSSSGNNLTGNLMLDNTYNFHLDRYSLENTSLDSSNLVDGKPIYYFENVSNIILNSSSDAGIVYLINCENVSVRDLLLEKNGYGIYLYNTTNSTLENNSAFNNEYGIYLESSAYNSLVGNNATSNLKNGISLYDSSYNNLARNLMWSNNYNFYLDRESLANNTVDPANLVDGKAIYYFLNASDVKLDSSSNAGTVYLINCKNSTIKDLLLENNVYGLYLYNTTNSILENNIVVNNECGIYLDVSSHNNLIENNVTSNLNNGISLFDSSYNTLNDNIASFNNRYGIDLGKSDNNVLDRNSAFNNGVGIRFYGSSNNKLIGNRAFKDVVGIGLHSSDNNVLIENMASSNLEYGIYLSSSGYNTLTSNLMWDNIYNFCADDDLLDSNTVDTSNLVDGKPIYYLVNVPDVDLDSSSNAGTVYLIKCTGASVKDLLLENNEYGICLYRTTNSILENNSLVNNECGIYLQSYSNYNTLKGNKALSNDEGISLQYSRNNILTENTACSNYKGIFLRHSSNNILIENTASSNDKGICLWSSSDHNTLTRNKADYNGVGINLESSDDNILTENRANSNYWGMDLGELKNNVLGGNVANLNYIGIFMANCENNNIIDNEASSNEKIGIAVDESNNNTLSGNTLNSNLEYGLLLEESSNNNTIYNNLFHNMNNAKFLDTNTGNVWNTAKVSGKNIVNGNYLGGNLWAKPDGNGFSQTHEDADGDGICEDFYDLGEGNIDYLPLKGSILPVANFSVNVTEGYAPLSVLFSDISANATSRKWDFNYDDAVDSTHNIVIHVYEKPGVYTVEFTAINGNGTDSKIDKITVLEHKKDDHHGNGGGSSSSSGGGGGGSPEPASNVETKELSQAFVTNGNHVKFEFTRNATCVKGIEFDAKRTFGKTTTIVEMLKGKSKIVPELPQGVVYKNVNIWVGNEGMGTPENIENALIGFKVEKSWIMENGIDLPSVTLHRYHDNVWNALPTVMADEDEEYFYFTAETPGFSPFAIAGEGKAVAISPEGGLEAEDMEEGLIDGEVTAPAEQEEKKSPGFVAVFALSGLLSGMYLLRMRKGQS